MDKSSAFRFSGIALTIPAILARSNQLLWGIFLTLSVLFIVVAEILASKESR